MTKLCSAAYFKSTPHYSSPNFIYVEDRWFLHNTVKYQLDICWYSSVSELKSFPTLAILLQGFCPRVYRDRKVIIVCEFVFRLNCKQHVMIHQGIKTFVCKYCSVLFVWKSNKSLVIDEKERSPMRVLQLNMTNSYKLNFIYAGFYLKTSNSNNSSFECV